MTNKKRQIVKRVNQEITKEQRDEVKNIIVNDSFYEPDCAVNNYIRHLKSAKKLDFNSNESLKLYHEVKIAFGLETHIPVANTVEKEYRPFLQGMIRDIEREFECKTASEKILAEMITSSYVRVIDAARELHNRRNELDNLFELDKKTGYMKMLSKELDRANRQTISALQLLIQKKSPQIELNIEAKTAFVAQNQQINAVKNEINERQ